MSPLQSTALKVWASSDEAAARAAIVQPYEDDLKYLLDQSDSSEAKASSGVAVTAASTQQRTVTRAIRVFCSGLALLPGAAIAQKLPITILRH